MTNPIIEYWPNGIKKSEDYILNGGYHRDPSEGPASIWYNENGEIEKQSFYLNGQYHRDPAIGPADIFYDKRGQIKKHAYFVNGKLHNPYGPAEIYYENNKIVREKYMLNGKFHNPYGPAFSSYTNKIFDWFLNGKEHTSEVYKYLNRHSLHYKNMTKTDFDIMWMNIL